MFQMSLAVAMEGYHISACCANILSYDSTYANALFIFSGLLFSSGKMVKQIAASFCFSSTLFVSVQLQTIVPLPSQCGFAQCSFYALYLFTVPL